MWLLKAFFLLPFFIRLSVIVTFAFGPAAVRCVVAQGISQPQVVNTRSPDSARIPELDEPTLLRPVFQKGKTYRFITENSVLMQMPGRGNREVVLKQQGRFDIGDREKETRPGVGITGITEHLVVEIKTEEKSIKFDSLDPKSQETLIGKHFRSALTRRIEMELNAEGRIIASEQTGRAQSASPLPGMPEFGPEELQQLIALIPQGYPDHAVKPDDEWELRGKRKVSATGEVEFEMLYRHAGQTKHEQHTCIVIEFGGRMRGEVPSQQAGAAVAGGASVGFQGNRIDGRMLYDPSIKMPRWVEQQISTVVNMRSSDPKSPAPVPVEMEQKVQARLLQIVDRKQE